LKQTINPILKKGRNTGMRNKLSRLSIIGLGCALFIIFGLNGSPAGAFSGGPPPSRTGAQALGSFAAEITCTACHTSFPLNSGPGTLAITGLPANYSPNQEVAVTVTLSQPDRGRYGFEATVLDDQGRKAGELVATDAARTRVINGTGNLAERQYIQHLLAGVTPNGTNQNSWTFTWRAPAQSVGRVTFYVAGNAANGNGNNQGDYIYNINASVQPASVPLGQFASVSAASFAAAGALTANGIAAGFGSGLSANTVSATTVPLPTQLDGTEVTVRDASNQTRNAGLFFVAPGQINYLIPAGTANGNATITVRRNGTDTAQGTLPIETVSPGLFAANANGQGVAAAVALRRRGGVDTFEPVAQFNSTTSRFEPVPIDLGPETDQVFLIGFGSGFRSASQAGLSCAIGGTNAEVLGVAAVAGFEGLDQANIRIPRSLAGRGLVDVVFRADNKPSNPLQIHVR
jgi:uncharacterized protein (TIGR03437 family)